MKLRPGRIVLAATAVLIALAGLVGLAFLSTWFYLKPTLPDVVQLRQLKLQMPLRVLPPPDARSRTLFSWTW